MGVFPDNLADAVDQLLIIIHLATRNSDDNDNESHLSHEEQSNFKGSKIISPLFVIFGINSLFSKCKGTSRGLEPLQSTQNDYYSSFRT